MCVYAWFQFSSNTLTTENGKLNSRINTTTIIVLQENGFKAEGRGCFGVRIMQPIPLHPNQYKVIEGRNGKWGNMGRGSVLLADVNFVSSPVIILSNHQRGQSDVSVVDSLNGEILDHGGVVARGKGDSVVCCYVPAIQRVVAAYGDRTRILPVSVEDPRLPNGLVGALDGRAPKDKGATMVHLWAGEAVALCDFLRQRMTGSSLLSALEKGVESLNSVNAFSHRGTLKRKCMQMYISVPMPQQFATFSRGHIGHETEPILLSALCSILEQLKWSQQSVPQSFSAPSGPFSSHGMHVEWQRLCSFDNARVSKGAEHLADDFAAAGSSLARAGFYFEKNLDEENVSGFCVHFETGSAVPTLDCPSFQCLLEDPMSELKALSPHCSFLEGRPTANVPINTTFSAVVPQLHCALDDVQFPVPHFPQPEPSATNAKLAIRFISASPCHRTPVLATASEDGLVCVWYTKPLRRIYSISSLQSVGEGATNHVEAWDCAECSFENEKGSERCGMCDTSAPGLSEVNDSDENSQSRSLLRSFLETSRGGGKSAAISGVSVLPNSSWYERLDEGLCDGDNPKSTEEEMKKAGKDPEKAAGVNGDSGPKFENWGDGWLPPSIEVTILKGMYAGVSGRVVETGKNHVLVLTAFESVERYPNHDDEKLSDYLKPLSPAKGEKAVVLDSCAHKGKTVVVVSIEGNVACCKFKQSDPPSSSFDVKVIHLAKLGIQVKNREPFDDGGEKTGVLPTDEYACEGFVCVLLTSDLCGSLCCVYRRENCETYLSGCVSLPNAHTQVRHVYHRKSDQMIISYISADGLPSVSVLHFSYEKSTFESDIRLIAVPSGHAIACLAVDESSNGCIFLMTNNGLVTAHHHLTLEAMVICSLPDFGTQYVDFRISTHLAYCAGTETLIDHEGGVLRPCPLAIAIDLKGRIVCINESFWRSSSNNKNKQHALVREAFPTKVPKPNPRVILNTARNILKMERLNFKSYNPSSVITGSMSASTDVLKWSAKTPHCVRGRLVTISEVLNDGLALSFQPEGSTTPQGYIKYTGAACNSQQYLKPMVEASTGFIDNDWYGYVDTNYEAERAKSQKARGNYNLPGVDCRPKVKWEYNDQAQWVSYTNEITSQLNAAWAKGVCTVGLVEKNSGARRIYLNDMCEVTQKKRARPIRRRVDPCAMRVFQELNLEEVECTYLTLEKPWKMLLPNGQYVVTVKTGDPTKKHCSTIYVNEKPMVECLSLNRNQFYTASMTVTVTGGELIISSWKTDTPLTETKMQSIKCANVVSVYVHSASKSTAPPLPNGDITAFRLEWEVEFCKPSLLERIDVNVALHSKSLEPKFALNFYDCQNDGILCPLKSLCHIGGQISFTMEAWVQAKFTITQGSHSASESLQPYTIMTKLCSGENAVDSEYIGDPQVEIIVFRDGAVKAIVYPSETQHGSKHVCVSTEINPRKRFRLQTEKWSHIAVAVSASPVNGTTLSLFVDGQLCSSLHPENLAFGHDKPITGESLLLGNGGRKGRPFLGHICNVRFWKGERSQSQIIHCMHVSCPNKVIGFKEDDNSYILGSWPLTSDRPWGQNDNTAANAFFPSKKGSPALYIPTITDGHLRYDNSGLQQLRQCIWNNKGNRDIIIDGNSASMDGDKWAGHGSVMSKETCKVGVHIWEIRIEAAPNNDNNSLLFSVGVCEPSMSINHIVGQTSPTGSKSWGYSSKGEICSNNVHSKYGSKYGKVGDVIAVILDCDNGILKFSLNGLVHEAAYKTGLKGIELALCVSMSAQHKISMKRADAILRRKELWIEEQVVETNCSEYYARQVALNGPLLPGVKHPVLTSGKSIASGTSFMDWKMISVPKLDVDIQLSLKLLGVQDQTISSENDDELFSQSLVGAHTTLRLQGQFVRRVKIILASDELEHFPHEVSSVLFSFRGKPGIDRRPDSVAHSNFREELYTSLFSKMISDDDRYVTNMYLIESVSEIGLGKEINMIRNKFDELGKLLIQNVINANSLKTACSATQLIQTLVQWRKGSDVSHISYLRSCVANSILAILPSLMEFQASKFAMKQMLELICYFWHDCPDKFASAVLVLFRKLAPLCKEGFSEESRLLRQMFNVNTMLLDEYCWPKGDFSGIPLQGCIHPKVLVSPQYSLNSNFVHLKLKATSSSETNVVFVNFDKKKCIERISLWCSKIHDERFSVRTVLYGRCNGETSDSPWEPLYSLSVNPRAGIRYFQAKSTQGVRFPKTLNQLKIVTHCVEWNAVGSVAGAIVSYGDSPRIVSSGGIKAMLCIYGQEAYEQFGISDLGITPNLTLRYKEIQHEIRQHADLVETRRAVIREAVQKLSMLISLGEQNTPFSKTFDSIYDDHSSVSMTTDAFIERIKAQVQQTEPLSPSNISEETLSVTKCISNNLQTLSMDILQLLHLKKNRYALEFEMYKQGLVDKAPMYDIWQSSVGPAVYLTCGLVSILNEQEQMGSLVLEENSNHLPSRIFTVQDCCDFFWAFVVVTPLPAPHNNELILLLRRTIHYASKHPGVDGQQAARFSVGMLQRALVEGESPACCKNDVFHAILKIATPLLNTPLAGYSIAPLVGVLSNVAASKRPSLCIIWNLYMMSKLLQFNHNQSSTQRHVVHAKERCSITGQFPIIGPLYLCISRPFSICEAAWKDSSNAERFWDDIFLKIKLPMTSELPHAGLVFNLYDNAASAFSTVQDSPKRWDPKLCHEGVKCSNSLCVNNGVIRGTRYMSIVEDCYNLCETCEAIGFADFRTPRPIFAAIRRPLRNECIVAIAKNTVLIDTVLNNQNNAAESSTGSLDAGNNPIETSASPRDAEVVTSSQMFNTLFDLLTNITFVKPFQIKLFLLANRVLCQVSAYALPYTIIQMVQTEMFSSYVWALSCSEQPFAFSAASRLINVFLQVISKNTHSDYLNSLSILRSRLKDVALDIVSTSISENRHCNLPFLLRLLHLVLSFRAELDVEVTAGQDSAVNSTTVQVQLGSAFLVITLSPHLTIFDLKQKISKLTGIDPFLQQLTTNGEVLADQDRLIERGWSESCQDSKPVELCIEIKSTSDDVLRKKSAFLRKITRSQCTENLNLAYVFGNGRSSTQIYFEERKCFHAFSISNEGKTLCLDKQSLSTFRTGVANYPISDGVVAWNIICDNVSPQKYIFVGVTEWPEGPGSASNKRLSILSTYLGASKSTQSWGYYSVSKKCYAQSHTKPYGKQYGTGDTVTVILDMVNDTLSFAINGENQGVAYTGCFKGKTIYPAVSLYGPKDSVTIAIEKSITNNTSIYVSDEEIQQAQIAEENGPIVIGKVRDNASPSPHPSGYNVCILETPVPRSGFLSKIELLLSKSSSGEGWEIQIFKRFNNKYKLVERTELIGVDRLRTESKQTISLKHSVLIKANCYIGIRCAEGNAGLAGQIVKHDNVCSAIFMKSNPTKVDAYVESIEITSDGFVPSISFTLESLGTKYLGLFKSITTNNPHTMFHDGESKMGEIVSETYTAEGTILLIIRCWGKTFSFETPYNASCDLIKREIRSRMGFKMGSQTLYITHVGGIATELTLLGIGDDSRLSRLRGIAICRVVDILCVVEREEYHSILMGSNSKTEPAFTLSVGESIQLFELIGRTPLETCDAALSWSACCKTLSAFSTLHELVQSQVFLQSYPIILASVLVGKENFVAVVADEFVQLFKLIHLNPRNTVDMQGVLRQCTLKVVLDTFAVSSRFKSSILCQLLSVVTESFGLYNDCSNMKTNYMGNMLSHLSNILLAERQKSCTVTQSELNTALEIAKLVSRFISLARDDSCPTVFNNFLRSITAPIIQNIGFPSAAKVILEWLVTSNMYTDQLCHQLRDLVESEVVNIFSLAMHPEGSPVLAVLMEVLQKISDESNFSSRLVNLAMQVVQSTEEAANWFSRTIFESPFLNVQKLVGRKPSLEWPRIDGTQKSVVRMPYSHGRQPITSRCQVLDIQGTRSIGTPGLRLASLLKRSSMSDAKISPSDVVEFRFKKHGKQFHWDVTLLFPEDVIVSSINVRCAKKVQHIGDKHSRNIIPSYVTVSTGTTCSQLNCAGSATLVSTKNGRTNRPSKQKFGWESDSLMDPYMNLVHMDSSSRTNISNRDVGAATIAVVGVTAIRVLRISFRYVPFAAMSDDVDLESESSGLPLPTGNLTGIHIYGTADMNANSALPSTAITTKPSVKLCLYILACSCNTHSSVCSALSSAPMTENVMSALLPHVPNSPHASIVLLSVGRKSVDVAKRLVKRILDFPTLHRSYANLVCKLCKINEAFSNVGALWDFVYKHLEINGQADMTHISLANALVFYIEALTKVIGYIYDDTPLDGSEGIFLHDVHGMFERAYMLAANKDLATMNTICQRFLITIVGRLKPALLEELTGSCWDGPKYRLIGMILGAYPSLLGRIEKWIVMLMENFQLQSELPSDVVKTHEQCAGMIAMLRGAALSGYGKNLIGEYFLEKAIRCFSQIVPKTNSTNVLLEEGLRMIEAAWNLNVKNQSIVATVISTLLESDTTFGPFLSRLLVKAVQMKQMVYVAIHSPRSIFNSTLHIPDLKNSSNNNNSVSKGSPAPISWDQNCDSVGKHLHIRGDTAVVSYGSMAHQSILANQCFSEGVHQWTIKVKSIVRSKVGHDIQHFIGITNVSGGPKKAHKMLGSNGSYIGATSSSWGYYAASGHIFNGSRVNNKPYGERYGKGDTVTVFLDCEQRTLSFALNGRHQGVAFNNLPSNAFYPAVSLYYKNDSATISNLLSSSPSAKGGKMRFGDGLSLQRWFSPQSITLRAGEIYYAEKEMSFLRDSPLYTLPADMLVLDLAMNKCGIDRSYELYKKCETSAQVNAKTRARDLVLQNNGNTIVDIEFKPVASNTCSENTSRCDAFDGQWGGYAKTPCVTFAICLQLHPSVRNELRGRGSVSVTATSHQDFKQHVGGFINFDVAALIMESKVDAFIGKQIRVNISSVMTTKRPKRLTEMFKKELGSSAHMLNFFMGTQVLVSCSKSESFVLSRFSGGAIARGLWPITAHNGIAVRPQMTCAPGHNPSFAILPHAPTEANTFPMLKQIASRGVLKCIIKRLLRSERSHSGSGTVSLYNDNALDLVNSKVTTNSEKEKSRRVLLLWLSNLESSIELPGFADSFAGHTMCISLLLVALGVDMCDIPSAADYMLDPMSCQVSILSNMFKARIGDAVSPKLTSMSVSSGTISRLLLRIGTLQGEGPRDPKWTDTFKDSVNVLIRKVSNAASSNSSTGGQGTSNGPTGKTGKSKESNKSMLWKPGFGHGHNNSTNEYDKQENERERKKKATVHALHCLALFLEIPNQAIPVDWDLFSNIVEASPLLSVFFSYLFGNSSMSLASNRSLHHAILRVVIGLAQRPETIRLCGKLPGLTKSIHELLAENVELCADMDDDEDDDEDAMRVHTPANDITDLLYGSDWMLKKYDGRGLTPDAKLREEFEGAYLAVDSAMKSLDDDAAVKLKDNDGEQKISSETETSGNEIVDGASNLMALYAEELRRYQFKSTDMKGAGSVYNHHYSGEITADIAGKVSKSRDKRVNRELKSLKRDMPIHFGSMIALRFDQTRPFVMKVLITGPSNTPYDSGCFVFDVYFPPNYPKVPPKVNLETTGAGRVRFNPNLYKCGKVCLSLLGTWQGGSTGQENWVPKKSTVLQVIVSVQGQILGSQYPYYNEPGVEQQWGKESSHEAARTSKNGGYERLRVATVMHAMLGQLQHPPPGFEAFVKEHFRLKQFYICKQIEGWIEEAKQRGPDANALQKLLKKLKSEFEKLGDPPDGVGVDSYKYEKYPF
jgi:ubiquitin-protein ligase